MTKGKIKTKRFLLCPNCGGSEHQVEHLFSECRNGSFGPWGCDECDHAFRGEYDPDGKIRITGVEKEEGRKVLCLLRFRDLYVVAGPYREHGDAGWYDYFFHSHQCPTNIMHQAEAVFDAAEGDDPHGVFRFVTSIPYDKEEHRILFFNGMSLEVLLRTFGTDGQDAPTDWPEDERGLLPGIAKLQDAYAKERAPKA